MIANYYYLFTVISVIGHLSTLTGAVNETLVDEYLGYLNNRTQSALEYELPTDARIHEPANKTLQDYGEFDFIVIGGGTTGCVVANRLSEIPQWKVLLLEAGTYPDSDLTGVPALFVADVFTKFNWGFYSIPQKYACLGFPEKKCIVPRGKGLGGSSLINGLVYSRGSKMDYDRWADILNDSSWNYENVLPYFIKAEHFHRNNFEVPLDVAYHGFNGPFHVSQATPPQNISGKLLDGSQELGYDIIDYNGKNQEGASILQFYTKDGKRFNAAMGYIAPIRNRKNLVVLDRSYVTKIDIDNDSKTAKGVIFTRDNKTYYAKACKEVVLSAGTIQSPQILMLSGIGPEEHLKSLGIPMVQNLSVGILREQTYSAIVFSLNVSDSESLRKSVADYLEGKGFLTRGFTYDYVGWFPTKEKPADQYSPNLEIFFFNISNNGLVQRYIGYSDETYKAVDADVPGQFTVFLAPLQPKSVGSVTLKSADPFEYPIIDPNLLSADEDKEILYQSALVVLELMKTDAMQSLNASLAFDRFPGCEHTEPLSREYWYCYFSLVTATAVHPTGTCRLGTVVDNKLKVFGIKGLRVADGSVIPLHINGHSNAACTMIGEKISDIIKKDYKQ